MCQLFFHLLYKQTALHHGKYCKKDQKGSQARSAVLQTDTAGGGTAAAAVFEIVIKASNKLYLSVV